MLKWIAHLLWYAVCQSILWSRLLLIQVSDCFLVHELIVRKNGMKMKWQTRCCISDMEPCWITWKKSSFYSFTGHRTFLPNLSIDPFYYNPSNSFHLKTNQIQTFYLSDLGIGIWKLCTALWGYGYGYYITLWKYTTP